ncbi:UxaA family hydrolase [Alicyclobacillus vulcanalis]|uniref:Altronate hydrolase n=1 Tax=Alicyclobacillus vulcanalis TaxID=252246 RepID=A0A1N7NHY3_9BACL|nr:altronate dehydratase family protein [Alicyclobacillus vulcanalis]SIS97910.1 altronate hydrolase [Alicyclobacillus vulcanalis]
MGQKVLHLSDVDDVVVALEPLQEGECVATPLGPVTARASIALGHKLAVRHVREGQPVHKYGFPIGIATRDIEPGEWVHTHNLRTALTESASYVYRPKLSARPVLDDGLTFRGFVRPDGQVGVRNEIWVLNTVGCVNKVAERLADLANARWRGDGIDGIYHFPHPYGCSQLGDDLGYTQALLAGLIRHPNAAGVLVVGLGCENNRIDVLRDRLDPAVAERVAFLELQRTTDEFAEGMKLLEGLVERARTFARQPVPIARLKLGLKCGGSDGLSGVTANPLVGQVADRVVARGGTALLSEVPEMFGAETVLMDRADSAETFAKIVDLIQSWKDYYTRHGQPVYENPSPGNKAGGITTLEEKSLGAVQKGGRVSQVVDVLSYGEPAVKPGLNLVSAPGNDMVSVSALAASGAHVILFTTGRGTPFGGPVPTLKIASNHPLAAAKPSWIDFDAGRILLGESMEALADDLFQQVIRVASGEELAKHEVNGYREIAIFKDGVTL